LTDFAQSDQQAESLLIFLPGAYQQPEWACYFREYSQSRWSRMGSAVRTVVSLFG
jgi:hypothetical protein